MDNGIKTINNESYLDEKIFGNDTSDKTVLYSDFDDSGDVVDTKKVKESLFDFDVDDSVFEVVNTTEGDEEVKEVPNSDDKFGIAAMLNSLIRDEWEAIDGYNSTIATLKDLKGNGSLADVENIEKVLTDIVNEENIHVGQLQKVLELVSPNATSIAVGEKEAAEQTEDTRINTDANALHPGMMVQTFEQPVGAKNNTKTNTDIEDTYCSLSDIDDEF